MAEDLLSLNRRLSHSPTIHDQKKIRSEDFESNPFATYAKMLEDFYSYTQFSESQEFLAIIVEEYTVIGNSKLPDYLLSSLSIYSNYSDNHKYYRITIPPLDAHLPVFESKETQIALQVFLDDASRIAICENPTIAASIKVGSIVRVSDAIIAGKLKKPCNIVSVLPTNDITVEESKTKLSDAYKTCITQRLPIKPPEEKVDSKIAQPTQNISQELGTKNIFSKSDSPDNSPRKFQLVGTPTSTPATDQEKRKVEEIKKSTPSADDIEAACALGPSESPLKQESIEPEKPIKDAFVRNGKTTATTQKLNNLGNAKFFNSLSNEQNAKIITASKELESIGPIYEYPEDLREPSMVIVKTVQYTYAEDYFEKIKTDKVPAAHFCIDLNGDIYQFTDTKNLVRSYNPTLDEKSIYVAVVNIPFRNSQQTLQNLPFRALSNAPFTFQNAARIAALSNTIALDKRSLKRFYDNRFKKFSGTSLKKTEILDSEKINGKTVNMFTLSDGRDTFPEYRMDYTEQQKNSLISLVSALLTSYKMVTDPKQSLLPKTRGLDVEVAAGDFSGVACPMHFSFTDMEPLNFYSIMEKLPKPTEA